MTKELGHNDKHLQSEIEQLDRFGYFGGRMEVPFSINVMIRIARDGPGR